MALQYPLLSRRMQVGGLVLLVLQIVLQQVDRATGQLDLRIAYITTDDGQYVSNGSIPAVMLAVDEVNSVFSDRYRLQMNTYPIFVSIKIS